MMCWAGGYSVVAPPLANTIGQVMGPLPVGTSYGAFIALQLGRALTYS